MSVIVNVVFWLYLIILFLIAAYCLLMFHLLIHYRRFHRKSHQLAVRSRQSAVTQSPSHPIAQSPFVTIQLPVYNEMYVVERLIDCILRFDYPKDRFEVQILDDSTDETSDLIRRKVGQYRAQGFQIEQICRSNRQGFKAGALRDAMPFVRGEFIAIFDADFLPHPDFLQKTLPPFADPKTGVVQTRWAHLNENYSLLTRLQALQLNVHFRVEQTGRWAGGYFLQFNGTAGVWRRSTIEDAGGWQADTLTEDFDLSFRAQLRGWKIQFLEEVASPAELPAEMNGLKSQQFRWMKGGAENTRKLLGVVWRSPLPFWQKTHAVVQLFGSSVYLLVFLLGLLSVPVFAWWERWEHSVGIFKVFGLALVAFVCIHLVANVQAPSSEGGFWKRLGRLLLLFPLFLAFSMGLGLHNSVAVAQGWLGKKSAFVRTPKFNIIGLGDSFQRKNYLAAQLPASTIWEGIFALYFLAACVTAFVWGRYSFLWLHALLALGYGGVFFYSVKHRR